MVFTLCIYLFLMLNYSLVYFHVLFFPILGVQEFPENIKCCKCLTIIEASVNPISK